MTEEQVTKKIMSWLSASGWNVLDYDFPGGGTGRKFHVYDTDAEKNKGIVIPDVVAVKTGVMLVLENKKVDTLSDYKKIGVLSCSASYKRLLTEAYPDLKINRIQFGIGFGGQPCYLDKADSFGVEVIISVENESDRCCVVKGALV